ncbi:hypothetical protein [Halomicrococcus sp. NG-SE-24]|uniref:hypothetical protein n=1 Tax=Halomicrococcus sp. NG-SE-24 TaxID=3436928 RepID=UPI003D987A72
MNVRKYLLVGLAGSGRSSVDLRSHGSHHERLVPYVASTGATLEYNVEAFPSLD